MLENLTIFLNLPWAVKQESKALVRLRFFLPEKQVLRPQKLKQHIDRYFTGGENDH